MPGDPYAALGLDGYEDGEEDVDPYAGLGLDGYGDAPTGAPADPPPVSGSVEVGQPRILSREDTERSVPERIADAAGGAFSWAGDAVSGALSRGPGKTMTPAEAAVLRYADSAWLNQGPFLSKHWPIVGDELEQRLATAKREYPGISTWSDLAGGVAGGAAIPAAKLSQAPKVAQALARYGARAAGAGGKLAPASAKLASRAAPKLARVAELAEQSPRLAKTAELGANAALNAGQEAVAATGRNEDAGTAAANAAFFTGALGAGGAAVRAVPGAARWIGGKAGELLGGSGPKLQDVLDEILPGKEAQQAFERMSQLHKRLANAQAGRDPRIAERLQLTVDQAEQQLEQLTEYPELANRLREAMATSRAAYFDEVARRHANTKPSTRKRNPSTKRIDQLREEYEAKRGEFEAIGAPDMASPERTETALERYHRLATGQPDADRAAQELSDARLALDDANRTDQAIAQIESELSEVSSKRRKLRARELTEQALGGTGKQAKEAVDTIERGLAEADRDELLKPAEKRLNNIMSTWDFIAEDTSVWRNKVARISDEMAADFGANYGKAVQQAQADSLELINGLKRRLEGMHGDAASKSAFRRLLGGPGLESKLDQAAQKVGFHDPADPAATLDAGELFGTMDQIKRELGTLQRRLGQDPNLRDEVRSIYDETFIPFLTDANRWGETVALKQRELNSAWLPLIDQLPTWTRRFMTSLGQDRDLETGARWSASKKGDANAIRTLWEDASESSYQADEGFAGGLKAMSDLMAAMRNHYELNDKQMRQIDGALNDVRELLGMHNKRRIELEAANAAKAGMQNAPVPEHPLDALRGRSIIRAVLPDKTTAWDQFEQASRKQKLDRGKVRDVVSGTNQRPAKAMRAATSAGVRALQPGRVEEEQPQGNGGPNQPESFEPDMDFSEDYALITPQGSSVQRTMPDALKRFQDSLSPSQMDDRASVQDEMLRRRRMGGDRR